MRYERTFTRNSYPVWKSSLSAEHDASS